MGLFDDSASGNKNEVRIGVSERESGSDDEERLRNDVETRMTDRQTQSDEGVSMEDIHEQNEKIIGLLKKIVDDGSDQIDRPDSISDQRRSDREQEDEGMRGGMDELL